MAANRSHLRRSPRRLQLETLEDRRLLASVPFGALPHDTAEFLLGRVAVTPVFLESNGANATESQDWTAAQIAETKAKIEEAMDWWTNTLNLQDTVHSLEFVYDYQYADTPVETGYEPIDGSSNHYTLWINDFLNSIGANTPADVHDDIRAFNHAQRQSLEAHWGFTIFVVDADEDLDDRFASGPYSGAYTFPGGRMVITPSTRSAQVIAHEMAHIFWARDEYSGGGSYTDRRGYYNAQNLNAHNNPAPGFVQQDSLLASGDYYNRGWQNNVTSDSSMAMLGWLDSDGNGVYDVLDVPHTMRASGSYDSNAGVYRMSGHSVVGTLPNRNSSGLQSDITINEVDALQYRIDGGPWMTAATYGSYEADLAAEVPLAPDATIQFRTVTLDDVTGQVVTASNLLSGGASGPNTTELPGVSGFVFNDLDGNGLWDDGELPVPGATLHLADAQGVALPAKGVEPDDFTDSVQLNNQNPEVLLTAEGWSLVDNSVLSRARAASTGNKVFGYFLQPGVVAAEWIAGSRELIATFSSPTTRVAIDAVANSDGDVGRLEAYDSGGNLLGRYTTSALADGEFETMEIVAADATIAWVVAFGTADTAVRLDNLRFGAETTATTGPMGDYLLRGVGSGTHYVAVESPAPTVPADGLQQVISTGAPVTGINFGVQNINPWHNFGDAYDVNDDGLVDQLDLVLAFSNLLVNGPRTLQVGIDDATPMVDVDDDGMLTPEDVRSLFARILIGPGSGESEPEQEPPVAATPGELRPETRIPMLPSQPGVIRSVSATAWTPLAFAAEDDWWSLPGDETPLRPRSPVRRMGEREASSENNPVKSGTTRPIDTSKRGPVSHDPWRYRADEAGEAPGVGEGEDEATDEVGRDAAKSEDAAKNSSTAKPKQTDR